MCLHCSSALSELIVYIILYILRREPLHGGTVYKQWPLCPCMHASGSHTRESWPRLKWLNMSDFNIVLLNRRSRPNSYRTIVWGIKYRWGMKICEFQPISGYMLDGKRNETVQLVGLYKIGLNKHEYKWCHWHWSLVTFKITSPTGSRGLSCGFSFVHAFCEIRDIAAIDLLWYFLVKSFAAVLHRSLLLT